MDFLAKSEREIKQKFLIASNMVLRDSFVAMF
jgi:hypothetical protein